MKVSLKNLPISPAKALEELKNGMEDLPEEVLQFDLSQFEELKTVLREYADMKKRSFLKKGDFLFSNKVLFLVDTFIKNMEQFQVFDREIAPLNLSSSERDAAFQARINLEKGLEVFGAKKFKQQHIDPQFTYYKKLLYIAKQERILA